MVVGPSGSGKTSIGRELGQLWEPEWPPDKPIVEAIAPDGAFDDVTGALSAVGLGTVPAWLRPYGALSMGEQFRADLARLLCDKPGHESEFVPVVDEFTSVVDRQIARMGALAFGKAWRRLPGNKVVLLTPHHDVLEWLEPCWVYDTGRGVWEHTRGRLRRPRFDLEIWQTDGSYWPMFEPHHYLKLPRMIGARYYVGAVDGEPVCHMAVSTMNKGKGVEARGCRLVVMPEWQGAGVGMRFLNGVCQLQAEGGEGARLVGREVTTIFHTSHPGLCAALRRDRKWRQVSAKLFGANKSKSKRSIKTSRGAANAATGYGGHFRAVQGFRYHGEQ